MTFVDQRNAPLIVPAVPTGIALKNFVRGPVTDEAWARPSLIALLISSLALYVWGLDRNGWADAYYSAAVEAGTKSWTGFFFGSLDASNFITVDKTPAAL